jgi:hypothetical protein
MAWKKLKQRSMYDGILIQHKALTELDDIVNKLLKRNITSLIDDIAYSALRRRAKARHLAAEIQASRTVERSFL